jgi:hypothetical protein
MSRRMVMAAQSHVLRQVSPESEPVIVDTDTPGAVVLELASGERLELDETELRAALGEAA